MGAREALEHAWIAPVAGGFGRGSQRSAGSPTNATAAPPAPAAASKTSQGSGPGAGCEAGNTAAGPSRTTSTAGPSRTTSDEQEGAACRDGGVFLPPDRGAARGPASPAAGASVDLFDHEPAGATGSAPQQLPSPGGQRKTPAKRERKASAAAARRSGSDSGEFLSPDEDARNSS
jgi:hypothetical protein